MTKRIITAVVLGILVVGAVMHLPEVGTALLLGGFVIVAAWEWSGLVGWTRRAWKIAYCAVVVVLAYGLWRWGESTSLFSSLTVLATTWWVIATAVVVAAQRQRLGRFIRFTTNGFCGLVVLLPAWSATVWLLKNDSVMLLSLFALVWVADGAAFIVGKRWGRRRLAAHVSPGKTWEGAVGGLGCGTICAVVISNTVTLSDTARIAFVTVAIVAIAASIIGDLFESVLKRQVGVKDSGQILPGHGGVMDRIDGYVAAAPIFVAGLYYGVNRL